MNHLTAGDLSTIDCSAASFRAGARETDGAPGAEAASLLNDAHLGTGSQFPWRIAPWGRVDAGKQPWDDGSLN